jgi:hypothetical protein
LISGLNQKKQKTQRKRRTTRKNKDLTDRFFSKIERAGRSIAVLSNQQVAGPDQRSQEERIERVGTPQFSASFCYPE